MPQDAPYAPVGAAASAPSQRWSGKRTAVIAGLALALTGLGAIAAAAASPHGFSPVNERMGRGFGPGGGFHHRQFGGGGGNGQPGPSQQGPSQQRFGNGRGQGFNQQPSGQQQPPPANQQQAAPNGTF